MTAKELEKQGEGRMRKLDRTFKITTANYVSIEKPTASPPRGEVHRGGTRSSRMSHKVNPVN